MIITRAPDVRLTCWLARCGAFFKTKLSKTFSPLNYIKNKVSVFKNWAPDHVSAWFWYQSTFKNLKIWMGATDLSESAKKHIQINRKSFANGNCFGPWAKVRNREKIRARKLGNNWNPARLLASGQITQRLDRILVTNLMVIVCRNLVRMWVFNMDCVKTVVHLPSFNLDLSI